MAEVPISFDSFERRFAGLPPAVLKNRFFEETPTQAKGAAMLARPGTDDVGAFGDGPIRGFYSLPGLFADALFFVSGNAMYRRETDGTTVPLTGFIFGSGEVSMTGVAGAGFERLFIADGTLLQLYQGGSHASGVLTGSGQVSEGDTLLIGDTYYKWTATVGAGSGTLADPWDVLIGADLAESLENMVKTLSFTGVSGTTYSANLGGQNLDVTAISDATTLTATARTDLAAGNDIATTVTSLDTAPVVAWGAATLTGGGTHALSGVEVPDGLPPVAVATLKAYILVAIGASDKFFWLAPGEITIDPLDFATAESQPDDVLTVTVVGDTAWFIGEGSTEVWYATGTAATPFAPIGGRTYDRGAVSGTVVNVKGTVFLVGTDYVVYAIGGGAERVSNHGVEELIRLTLEAE
jgi:hypothetical protein